MVTAKWGSERDRERERKTGGVSYIGKVKDCQKSVLFLKALAKWGWEQRLMAYFELLDWKIIGPHHCPWRLL